MLDFFKRNKVALGGGVAMLLALYVYLTYFSTSSAPLTASAPDISGDLLVTLNSLHTIRLDNTIFSNSVFVSLSDFGVTIPAQAAGRRNPFAPVGSGNAPTTPATPTAPTGTTGASTQTATKTTTTTKSPPPPSAPSTPTIPTPPPATQ